jgi:hypothetical protein
MSNHGFSAYLCVAICSDYMITSLMTSPLMPEGRLKEWKSMEKRTPWRLSL